MNKTELIGTQPRTEIPEKATASILELWNKVVDVRKKFDALNDQAQMLQGQLSFAQQAFGEFVAFTREHLNVPAGWDMTDDGKFFYEMTPEQIEAQKNTLPEQMRNQAAPAKATKTEEEMTAPVDAAPVCQKDHCSDPGDVTGA
jgi:hypothetical protein